MLNMNLLILWVKKNIFVTFKQNNLTHENQYSFYYLWPFTNAQNAEGKNQQNTWCTWHKAAADVKSDAYFDLMADDAAVFVWTLTPKTGIKRFQDLGKTLFDKGEKHGIYRFRTSLIF